MLRQCESKPEAGFFVVFVWVPESSLAVSIPVITGEPSLKCSCMAAILLQLRRRRIVVCIQTAGPEQEEES